jgi:hypothetical protein
VKGSIAPFVVAVASLLSACKEKKPPPSTSTEPAVSPPVQAPLDVPTLAPIELSAAGPEWVGFAMKAPKGATASPQSPGRLRVVSPGTGTELGDFDLSLSQHPDEAATVATEQKSIANVYAAQMKFHRKMTFVFTKETPDELEWYRTTTDAPDDKPYGFRLRVQAGDKSVWCGPVQDRKQERLALLREMCASLAKK